ncbi:MAG: 2-amino-4-hydroxy-6-hydroxymethyldihydropteridine diphosphokinase [Candidatus Promineifilaceae bacterium]
MPIRYSVGMMSQPTVSTHSSPVPPIPSRRYFVSIGSNIRPKINVPLILDALLQRVGVLHISTIVETVAVDMDDAGASFLNLTAAFDSGMNSAELKVWLNQIEHDLGRDRSHPLSKRMARPADIDEIFSVNPANPVVDPHQLPPEPHIRPMLVELLDYLTIAGFSDKQLLSGVDLSLRGVHIGRKAMTLQSETHAEK